MLVTICSNNVVSVLQLIVVETLQPAKITLLLYLIFSKNKKKIVFAYQPTFH